MPAEAHIAFNKVRFLKIQICNEKLTSGFLVSQKLRQALYDFCTNCHDEKHCVFGKKYFINHLNVGLQN